ncbi:MAG: aminotransferase [Alphaproteobacteria bacterium]|nr:aminotransferase [Alphaproteobacteria bacterium]
MPVRINPNIMATAEPPIPEAMGWLAEAGVTADRPLLNLAQAVPSYPPAEKLREAMADAARLAETAFYTPILGIESLRERFAQTLSNDYRGQVDAEDVAISAGGNHAFCMAVMALAGPGDEIIVPQPCYFNHEMWCTMQGIRVVPLPCHAGPEGLLPDPHEAESLIGPRTRAILLVSPNNPTGTVYSPDLVQAFFDLAHRKQIALLIDETYRDFLPDVPPPHRLFSDARWRDGFVHLYSFSKAYSLTGYRIGALAAGPRIMDAIGKIADTVTICPSHIGQLAVLYGLEHLGDWKRARRDEMTNRVVALDQAFADNPGGFRLRSRGAFFAYIEHPFKGQSAANVARMLVREQAVFTLPGPIFGIGQERYVRAAFANVDEAGIHALARRLDAQSAG